MHSKTANGAFQYSSSENALVDFFSAVASQRTAVLSNEDTLIELFEAAREGSESLAIKIIFFSRDPRNGAGEKAAGRKLLAYLAKTNPEFTNSNILNIVKYGSWKDIQILIDNGSLNENAIMVWAANLVASDRLAAKWAPRKGPLARALRD